MTPEELAIHVEEGAKVKIGEQKASPVERGVSLHAIISDMRHRYLADRGVKPKYLILGPDYADQLSEEIYHANMIPSKHTYMIRGGEKYNGLTILILPGELKFIEVAG
jgi:hypothetical protein